MAQFFEMHPTNPQTRLVRGAAEILRNGGVIVYPTDSSYAFGFQLGAKDAMERVRRIRGLDDKHNFTLVCRDLAEITTYAKIDNHAFRTLKGLTPGPYTFIFEATKQVPRRMLHPKRKGIGIRVPDNAICRALLTELDEPILSATLMLPGAEHPMTDPEAMRSALDRQVDLIIDGGAGGLEPSTVVDMTTEPYTLVRSGLGDPSPFES